MVKKSDDEGRETFVIREARSEKNFFASRTSHFPVY
jgi:hypothetical protein